MYCNLLDSVMYGKCFYFVVVVVVYPDHRVSCSYQINEVSSDPCVCRH